MGRTKHEAPASNSGSDAQLNLESHLFNQRFWASVRGKITKKSGYSRRRPAPRAHKVVSVVRKWEEASSGNRIPNSNSTLKIAISDTLARRLYVLGRRVDLAFANVDDSNSTSLRFAFLSALGAVLRFYRRVNETKIYDRLFTLYCAFWDLESGLVHPALRPKRGSGRTRDSAFVWLTRSRVAAGIECLIVSGMKKKAAVILAAAKYRGIGRLVRPGQELRGCISTWHRDFMGNRVTHPGATAAFGVSAMQYGFGLHPRAGHDDATRRKYLRLAEQFLTRANEHATKIIKPTAGFKPE